MKKDLLAIILILIFTLLVSRPLLVPGFYVVHDDQQIARLFLLNQTLFDGQFPPRWVSGLGFGFGYPLFNFYPPLVYYLGEIFHIFGSTFTNSVKTVFFASIFLSGLSVYIFTKEFWGRLSATVSAVFYILLPYRAIDIYVRGAMAESFSFVWPPLILWSLYKLRTEKKLRYLFSSSLFLAFLMLTHNLILLPFLLLLPIWLVFLVFLKKERKKFIFLHLPLVFLTFLLITAYFWLPSILEKKYTLVDDLLLVNLADYNIHFVYPQQLWNWPWGFGGSASGLGDGLSFKIGKLHIILSILSLVFFTIFTLKKGGKSNLNFKSVLVPTLIILFVISSFMTTYFSKFVWDLIKPLDYLQFPWRFLIFSGLFSSILAGAFINQLRLPILKILFSAVFIASLAFTNVKLFQPQTYRPELTDSSATSSEEIEWRVSSSSFEYVPKGVETYKSSLGTNIVTILNSDIAKQPLEFLDDPGSFQTLKDSSIRKEFVVQTFQNSTVKANTFNFPGWQLKIDGRKTTINDQNRLKLITFNVPAGKHAISLEFTNTPIRTLANYLSLFSVIFCVVLIINKKWTKKLF